MYLKNTLIVFLSSSFLFLNLNSKITEITISDNLIKTLFCFAPSTVSLKQDVPQVDKYLNDNRELIQDYKLKFVAEIIFSENEDKVNLFSFENDQDIKSLLAQVKRKVIKQINWYYMVHIDMYEQYMQLFEINTDTSSPEPNSGESTYNLNPKIIPSEYFSELEPSASPEIPDERGCYSE